MDREEWASVIQEAKAVRGAQNLAKGSADSAQVTVNFAIAHRLT